MSRAGSSSFPAALVLLLVVWLAGPGAAQCSTAWTSAGGLNGTDNNVLAAHVWDPDGPGPQPERVVLGGPFVVAGDAFANRIVAYEPVAKTWSTFGAGVPFWVNALATLANGELVAGGSTWFGLPSPNGHVQRWDGTAWTPVGGGVNGSVKALAVRANGDLVVGGSFSTAGGVPSATSPAGTARRGRRSAAASTVR